jgi:hypothetical protein
MNMQPHAQGGPNELPSLRTMHTMPLPGEVKEARKQQVQLHVEALQKDLTVAKIEKDKLEQEFFRHGSTSKTKIQIQRKRELEQALEQSNGRIQAIKAALRD